MAGGKKRLNGLGVNGGDPDDFWGKRVGRQRKENAQKSASKGGTLGIEEGAGASLAHQCLREPSPEPEQEHERPFLGY